MQSADIWDSELYNETVLADAIVLHFQGEEIVIWQRPEAEIARRVGEAGGEYRTLSIDVKTQADIDYWRSLIDRQKDGDDPTSSSGAPDASDMN